MAISIKFGNFNGDNELVDKENSITWLNDSQAYSCKLVNTDVINPILKVEAAKVTANYVQIVDFGRYYYVESCESIAGAHCLLRCHVDVLYTYCAQIKELECLVHRNEDITKWKRDVCDNAILASNRRIIEGWNFGDSIIMSTSDEYILGIR